MKRIFALSLVALLVLGTMPTADAQNRRRSARRAPVVKTGPETALLGIALYDSGEKIAKRFGSPDKVEPLSVNFSDEEGGGGSGGGGGEGGGPGGGRTTGDANWTNEMLKESQAEDAADLRQQSPDDGGEAAGRGGGRGRGGRGGGGGGEGGGDGENQVVSFTRWIYIRSGARYGFVLDKYGKCVQIEAIGLKDPAVKTKRGVTFGATLQTIVAKYKMPEGYEIAGETYTMRYLNSAKVAFLLAKLKVNDKHRVTGIVVAAGRR